MQAAVIREDLVATAVKFLQNPKVQASPLSQKKAFLEKKGLTNAEVEEAGRRAGVQSVVFSSPVAENQLSAVSQTNSLPTVIAKDVEMTRWMKAREVLAVVTMLVGVSYAAQRLYKEFIKPWLFGTQTDSKRLDKLERIITETNEKLVNIGEVLDKQQEKLQILSHDINRKTSDGSYASQSTTGFSEIKAELASLKGLLLNRRQFPPMPTTTPVLPAWQLASTAAQNTNQKGAASPSSGETPDIALSANPASGAPAKLVISDNTDTENSNSGTSDEVVTQSNSPEDVSMKWDNVSTADDSNVECAITDIDSDVKFTQEDDGLEK
ncbi:peroxisomal membrane protein PEX14-like isoform X2 [Mya arenaria]|uniref:peroxisomal membrane protein PEX14-like isoform X2 n=1 Tax=Mya arenaria TaxID=6604 RepID=UPI0022E76C15|nr:peroxisomal membrane protein PEX14-like isoform X2 [Mya arenaria]